MRSALWKVGCFGLAVLASSQALAWGPVPAHVTLIDSTSMGAVGGDTHDSGGNQPVAILFKIDQPITTNPCGSPSPTDPTTVILMYMPQIPFTDSSTVGSPSGELAHPTGNDRQMVNEKAMLSTLQIALATGLKVNVYGAAGGVGSDGNGYCYVGPVQLLNQY